jgi:hypothetical protein
MRNASVPRCVWNLELAQSDQGLMLEVEEASMAMGMI